MYWEVWIVGLAVLGALVFVWAMRGIGEDWRGERDLPPFVLPYVEGTGSVEVPRPRRRGGVHRCGRGRHRCGSGLGLRAPVVDAAMGNG
ncbi:hypothetical protein [Nocardia otitidiscaviarum]|uniref:hypothetical protein n=1 Tax=Nocardia otitidiscaviarum TaxID=1823 RepID=UPI00163D9758|nr:hypothetical protein [Nocardia otitidiscaviarum]MBF6178886.1 hypothetical protein [Nocardia otitidiscaviarum]